MEVHDTVWSDFGNCFSDCASRCEVRKAATNPQKLRFRRGSNIASNGGAKKRMVLFISRTNSFPSQSDWLTM